MSLSSIAICRQILNIRGMPVLPRTSQRVESLLRQILDTLEELTLHYQKEEEQSDDEDDAPQGETERDLIIALTEEAAERGLDEDRVEKILRSALYLAEEAGER